MYLLGDEDPIIAGFIWALAAWTLLVHIAVAAGGSFNRLLQSAPLAMVMAAIGWYSSRKKSLQAADAEPSIVPRILWLVPAGLVLFGYRFGYVWFWLGALLLLTAAWLWLTFVPLSDGPASRVFRHRPHAHSAPGAIAKPLPNAFGLIALCLVCVFITLLLHQPDIDDAFYISVAADAHRHPDRAIWSTDTVHDDANLPVFLPIYKAEAFEYLIALVARLLHISSVRAAHTALPIAFSILVAVAWAQLTRTIHSKNWLAIAAVTIVISIFAGATKPGPANYAFTRLQQGKSVMVSAIVPILCVYAFRQATIGGWRNAAMLAAAQIAGVGLSSTSIVIGPAVACAVGFCCLPLGKHRSLRFSSARLSPQPKSFFKHRDRQPRDINEEPDVMPSDPARGGTSETGVFGRHPLLLRIILILATCIYPVSMALLMRSKMLAIDWLAHTPARSADIVFTNVLGDRAQLWFFLATLVGAWAVVPRRSQSLLLAPGIVLLGVMINPLLTHLLQSSVFTPNTYWRGLWVLPWLVWSAAFVCGLSSLVGALFGLISPVLSRPIAVGFAAVVLAVLLGRHPIWRHQNGTTLGLASLAVDEPEYTVAERLATETPPGLTALAPEKVACWTAVQDQRPPLIFVRSFYTQSTPGTGGIEDVRFRNRLGEIAGKPRLTSSDVAALLTGVDRYRLGAIVLTTSAGNDVAIALRKIGFVEETVSGFSIWIRNGHRRL
jgi:hypothetical protein